MRTKRVALLLVAALLVAAVLPLANTPTYAAPEARQTTVRIAVIPVMDVLPLYVAQAEEYFMTEGLAVELVPVNGPVESAQLLLSGEVDGMLTDLIVTAIFNQDTTFAQVVAQSRRAYPDHPLFRVLASPNGDVTSPADIAGVPIGISENSVIEYITTRILENEGLSAADLNMLAEPNIPVRFQLLLEGSLPAATLPDPLAQAAIDAGAKLIADDSALSESELSQSVIIFRKAFIDGNPDAIEAFLRAWMSAADAINADPEAYRELWIENTNVPDTVKDTFELPPFPTYDITQQEAWDDVVDWLLEAELVENAASFEDSVNPAFLEAITPEDMGDDMAMTGDAANGEALFASTGCVGCHVLEGDATVGPSMEGIASRAASEVEDLSAEEYLVQAIVEPGAHVVDGYNNIMPAYDTLPESDINDIVAYLMTFE